MPQLIPHGPNIPESLLQAHEDGKVVFFCGAGISMPAGLPDFLRLTKQLFRTCDAAGTISKQIACGETLDFQLHFLETKSVHGRKGVREELAHILDTKQIDNTKLDTHRAFLDLATDRAGELRLVTTNFDRLFLQAGQVASRNIPIYAAPVLPIPKNNRWNGLVHLHGLLPEDEDQQTLNQLVLTSGDFGLAYLVERWAARFVTELLRNYTICFVGYSLNDPVLRYIFSALLADKQMGQEPPHPVYAFDTAGDSASTDPMEQWHDKGAQAILYNDHSSFHESIKQWARIYREGLTGKATKLAEVCRTAPPQSESLEPWVSELVIWAIKDERAVRQFAQMEPLPPIEWLPKLEKQIVEALGGNTPHKHWFLEWFKRHRCSIELFLWVAQQPLTLRGIAAEVGRVFASDTTEPKTPDCSKMEKLWGLLLTGVVQLPGPYSAEPEQWEEQLRQQGLTPSLRLQFRELLKPVLRFKKTTREWSALVKELEPLNLGTHLDWELSFTQPHLNARLHWQTWGQALPSLIYELELLLENGLGLLNELEQHKQANDYSHAICPSISEHTQRRGVFDWTLYIELIRDAWNEVAQKDRREAASIAARWLNNSFPLFKRLAFYAASNISVVSPKTGLTWLLAEKRRWLWATETKHEVILLIKTIAPVLSEHQIMRLEKAILAGPPARPGERKNEAEERKAREILLRMQTMQDAGAARTPSADVALRQLLERYPDWEKLQSASNGIPFRLQVGYQPQITEGEAEPMPDTVLAMAEWLESNTYDEWVNDPFEIFCKKSPQLVVEALKELARNNVWPAKWWGQALRNLPEEKVWQEMIGMLNDCSDEALFGMAHELGCWLEKHADLAVNEPEPLAKLAVRLASLEGLRTGLVEPWNALHLAINHPVGMAANSLLSLWFARKPKPDTGLPEYLKTPFTQFCEDDTGHFEAAKVMLALNLNALYSGDFNWTRQNLLPLFCWEKWPETASSVWQAFLHSRRFQVNLLYDLRVPLLATPDYLNHLPDDYKESYVSLFTWLVLNHDSLFTVVDQQEVLGRLPPELLPDCIATITSILYTVGDQAEQLWENRVEPLIRNCFPSDRRAVTPELLASIVELLAAARGFFPRAWAFFRPWFECEVKPPQGFYFHELAEAGICRHNPKEALGLLAVLAVALADCYLTDLAECLNQIAESDPELETDGTYKALRSRISE